MLIVGIVVSPLAAQEDSILQEGQAVDTNAIAVLPIEILSTDPKVAALAVEAYEGLINRISSIKGVYVLEQALVQPYADSALPAREIGRQLGVGMVLESSVLAEYPMYRLRFTKIDTQTGLSVGMGTTAIGWMDDRNAGSRFDPATMLSDAVSRIAEGIEERISPKPKSDWERTIAEAQAIVLDSTRSDRERLEALAKLSPPRNMPAESGRRYAEVEWWGSDALSGSVAVAAGQLAINADDPMVRMGVWDRMAGVRNPYLIQPLLHALSSDGDARVRVEAAKTLVDFIDQPGVRDALNDARSGDAAESVREAAHFSLLSPAEQQDELRAVVLNTSLTDDERYRALARLRFEYENSDAIDRSVVVAMTEVARSSDRVRLRSFIWSSLSETNDPYVVKPLLQALVGDPAETVRETVAGGLAEFIDDPGVREALETATVDDPSPLVRKRAEESLLSANR